MCGIAGLVNFGDRQILARMTHVQAHRGPNDSGLWERRFSDGSYIGLGSRRLAILDLSADGHMPMCNEDGTVWITFNGEIYNFAELRRELKSKGHRFASNTDTEVVIHLYEQEGADCVQRLRGMFAFAICDLRSGKPELFLARDHFGVKPFYYVHRGSKLAFASEVKALLEVPQIAAEMDLESLHQYLTFLWVPEPKTMFKGIFKLPAGHCATFCDGELKIRQYWDLSFPLAHAQYPRSDADLAEEIRERFRQSVEGQMVSDVPIGAFLSAGLDSSSIVEMMCKAAKQPVRTYTITFPPKYRVGESTLDDPSVPARMARQLGCEHHEIVVEPDVVELLPRLTWHMDEPTADPAIIAAYLVCREARKQSTVLLSGVGGDELFAGYRKHAAQRWADAYRRMPAAMRTGIEHGVGALPSLRGTMMKGSVRLAKKMARSASLAPEERFIRDCTYLDGQQKTGLYMLQIQDQLLHSDPAVSHHSSFNRVRGADFLNQMLYLDTKIFMPSLNLNYNDKMSMASSVEVRVPFLDRELAEFAAWNVPPNLKLKGFFRPVTKHIFREAMRDALPAEVLRQPKAGFAAPVDYWLANDLREMVDDLLGETAIRQRGLFEPKAVRRFIDEQRSGAEDWSMQIWQFLTLENWMRVFLDGGARQWNEEFNQPREAATA
ncbi:MAG TPA: asparagine synthase (glutamine-hydrolyzing) [Candidatus Aquilonibacter sp.]|jgi:asparagine synthase (glutamine-hydrolysing)|nr:asparagine synthase (glutamine-hydrolyzing) [Candidatus Aquilonibacter sp.]